MNTEQITKILRAHPLTTSVFIGCVPADGIPSSDFFPYAVVVNTDDHYHRGQHWLALYVQNESVVEYFDSYGLEPYDAIASYLAQFPAPITNSRQLQSLTSKACGQFCIYYLTERCRGRSMKSIVDGLQRRRDPDAFVVEYCRQMCRQS